MKLATLIFALFVTIAFCRNVKTSYKSNESLYNYYAVGGVSELFDDNPEKSKLAYLANYYSKSSE